MHTYIERQEGNISGVPCGAPLADIDHAAGGRWFAADAVQEAGEGASVGGAAVKHGEERL